MTLTIPVRVEAPDGTIGYALMEIGPDHPDYAKWQAYFRRTAPTKESGHRKQAKKGRMAPIATNEGRK